MVILVLEIFHYLFTSDARVSIGGGAKHQIVQNGSIGRDANSATNHHCHFVFIPVLIAATKWALQTNLWWWRIRWYINKVVWIKIVSKFPRPRALCLDMHGQVVFMWRRC